MFHSRSADAIGLGVGLRFKTNIQGFHRKTNVNHTNALRNQSQDVTNCEMQSSRKISRKTKAYVGTFNMFVISGQFVIY
jgi:hypothetical protein